MIEVTLTEVVLFVWAILATAAGFKLRQEADMAKLYVREMVTNDVMRDQVVSAYKEAHRRYMEKSQ